MAQTQPPRPIRLLVFDVDGTLTDSGMYLSESGDEFKRFHTRDGMAMKRLERHGVPVGLLSSGLGKVMVQRRAEMLGLSYCEVGDVPKQPILDAWRTALELEWSEVAYVGDDVNDLECIRAVGFSACPSDAVARVRAAVDVVLERRGGDAVAREFIDRFIGDCADW
jgi:YrbI family 3-deoxy-D-manno-octulosonate 8-phosphate phosphatase